MKTKRSLFRAGQTEVQPFEAAATKVWAESWREQRRKASNKTLCRGGAVLVVLLAMAYIVGQML